MSALIIRLHEDRSVFEISVNSGRCLNGQNAFLSSAGTADTTTRDKAYYWDKSQFLETLSGMFALSVYQH